MAIDNDSPQVTMRYFDDWKSLTLTCSGCDWRGPPDPLALQLNDSDNDPLSIFHCPRCGRSLLAIRRSVSMEETLANIDKLSPEQRASVLERQKWLAELDAARLKTPDQLPELDLDAGPQKLVWDIEEDSEEKPWNVIRHGTRVLWRQPGIWEGYREFSRIVAIIRKRYGKTIRDLEPTEIADMWLGGDDLGASPEIDKARRRLGWKRLK